MMNIGILTLYKVRNLGACLQATAMKSIIESYGHRVSFLDGYDSEFAKQLFKNDMGRMKLWTLPFRIKKENKFRKYFKTFPEAGLCESEKMDGVIIGSDSLWIADYGKDPMPAAFFGNVNCDVVCSYAPSVGGKYDLSKYTSDQLGALDKIKYITVRDSVSREFVREVTGKDCSIVIDPTLLCNWNDCLKNIGEKPNKNDYVLTYGGFDKKTANAINQFARRENIKVINVGTFNRWFKRNIAVSPDEFIRYIAGARYVITSMFHGVMLSVALCKEFQYISVDPNRDIKISTLIDSLDLRTVMLKKQDIRAENLFTKEIDFSQVSARLDILRRDSTNELNNILSLIDANATSDDNNF